LPVRGNTGRVHDSSGGDLRAENGAAPRFSEPRPPGRGVSADAPGPLPYGRATERGSTSLRSRFGNTWGRRLPTSRPKCHAPAPASQRPALTLIVPQPALIVAEPAPTAPEAAKELFHNCGTGFQPVNPTGKMPLPPGGYEAPSKHGRCHRRRRGSRSQSPACRPNTVPHRPCRGH